MYGMDKSKLRLRAMDEMAKEKPSIKIEMGEDEMPEEEYGEEGMISMAVSPAEKMMILKMRGESEEV